MDDLERKYMEFQSLDKEIKEKYEQMQKFETQVQEINSVIEGLESIKEVKKGEGILVPISSGIFLKAKLEANQELLMNVGAGVVVSKNVEDAKRLLKEQIEKADKVKEKMSDQISKMVSKAIPLQEELKKLVESQES